MITKEQITSINNHFIITKQRSGSKLLAVMLGANSSVQSIHEENIYEKFKSKYSNKTFNNLEVLNDFLDDLYEFSNHGSINFYLPSRKNLTIEISPYFKYELTFKQFVNLFYLFFFSTIKNKTVKTIINKDISYQVQTSKIFKEFPESKFIFLVRDSITNINSVINTGLTQKNVAFQSAIWKYMTHDILRLKKKLPQNSYIFVKFEDLIGDSENTLKKICCFLNLNFEPAMLNNVEQMLKIDDYASKRYFEEHSISKSFKDDIIHSSSRKILDKSKIKNHALNQKELMKIVSATNSLRIQLGYKNDLTIKTKYFAYNLVDLYNYLKGYTYILILNKYYTSKFFTKVFFRKVNVFNLFN